jgi:hypothetical protein
MTTHPKCKQYLCHKICGNQMFLSSLWSQYIYIVFEQSTQYVLKNPNVPFSKKTYGCKWRWEIIQHYT